MILVALFFMTTVIQNALSVSLVVELKDKTFHDGLGEYDWALVKFYAPWCGHCKRLAPEFEKAAKIIKTHDLSVQLVRVDCTGPGKATCGLFNVAGYPTLKIFEKGQFKEDYDGPREAAGIAKYMVKLAAPRIKEIPNEKALDEFCSGLGSVVVGFFKHPSALSQTFDDMADRHREVYRYGVSSDDELVKKYGEKIVIFRPKHLHNVFEPDQIEYLGDADPSAVGDWLAENMHGLVDVRTSDNKDSFKNPLAVVYFNIDYEKDPKGTNYWRNRVLKVAEQFRDKFNFAVSPMDDFVEELNDFGFEQDADNTQKHLVAAWDNENRKFPMTKGFSSDNLQSFVKKVIDNELKPYYKSEAVPRENRKPVKIVVQRNFDDVITNNGKDTLIFFYSKTERRGRIFLPKLDNLAGKMTKEDVVFGKMDVDKNDVPRPYTIQSMPTIYWVPQDREMPPVMYNGQFEYDDVLKFVAEMSTKGLKLWDRNGVRVQSVETEASEAEPSPPAEGKEEL